MTVFSLFILLGFILKAIAEFPPVAVRPWVNFAAWVSWTVAAFIYVLP